jgi:hypothetical protein
MFILSNHFFLATPFMGFEAVRPVIYGGFSVVTTDSSPLQRGSRCSALAIITSEAAIHNLGVLASQMAKAAHREGR